MFHPLITSAFELMPTREIGIPERLFRLSIPFLLGIPYLVILYFVLPYDLWLIHGGLLIAYIIPPAGKETVIPIGIAVGLPWWMMAFSVALMDILAGVFMALNFDIALKIPGVGGWIRKFIAGGEDFFAKRPWLERFYFMGVVLFVMFPLQGSGGIGATLVGRMMGLSPGKVLLAITMGALIGCTVIALGAEVIKNLFLMNPALGIAVAVIVVVVLLILYAFYRMRMRKQTG
ncbi:MAG: small multi-drug export protein [Methanoregulaceae archaeon]|jgi:uncharacterized membrane protein|nr:small multi-drug export protein [Methanoregulaceae archaeon]